MMKPIFTTAGIHARDRFAYWHEVAGKIITGHDSQASHRDRFDAELKVADLADIGMFDFTNQAMACARERRHIRSDGEGEFFLCRNGSGEFALDQNERRNVFRRGDMALIDSNLAYNIRFTDKSQMLLVKIPRIILESRFGPMRDFAGARLSSESGLNAFLSDLLDGLRAHVSDFDEATSELVRNQLVDLLTHAVGSMAGENKRLTTPRTFALMRLRSAIDARLSNSSLNSESAARAAGMSVRYANDLLAANGNSIAKLIRGLRLERCKKALADPSQDHRTIGEIAFGWGFSDLTNFGRLFGAAFGMTPRSFRQNRRSQTENQQLAVAAPDTIRPKA